MAQGHTKRRDSTQSMAPRHTQRKAPNLNHPSQDKGAGVSHIEETKELILIMTITVLSQGLYILLKLWNMTSLFSFSPDLYPTLYVCLSTFLIPKWWGVKTLFPKYDDIWRQVLEVYHLKPLQQIRVPSQEYTIKCINSVQKLIKILHITNSQVWNKERTMLVLYIVIGIVFQSYPVPILISGKWLSLETVICKTFKIYLINPGWLIK